MKINPKQLEKMARKMGMQMAEIEAERVIIRTPEKEIVITNPQVSKVNMMGQDTFQISGEVTERSREPFTEEDIKTVIGQTGASREEVMQVLRETHGDLAESIMRIKKKK
ncbi:MAG: nascent polypeptide-associated complex protein [Candidatus Aenigmatarchaeota archaeon]